MGSCCPRKQFSIIVGKHLDAGTITAHATRTGGVVAIVGHDAAEPSLRILIAIPIMVGIGIAGLTRGTIVIAALCIYIYILE